MRLHRLLQFDSNSLFDESWTLIIWAVVIRRKAQQWILIREKQVTKYEEMFPSSRCVNSHGVDNHLFSTNVSPVVFVNFSLKKIKCSSALRIVPISFHTALPPLQPENENYFPIRKLLRVT